MQRKPVIKVQGTTGEPALSVMRKFSRKVNDSGILRKVRGERFFKRTPSDFVKKTSALSRLKKRSEREKLVKQGKIKDEPIRKGGKRPMKKQ